MLHKSDLNIISVVDFFNDILEIAPLFVYSYPYHPNHSYDIEPKPVVQSSFSNSHYSQDESKFSIEEKHQENDEQQCYFESFGLNNITSTSSFILA